MFAEAITFVLYNYIFFHFHFLSNDMKGSTQPRAIVSTDQNRWGLFLLALKAFV